MSPDSADQSSCDYLLPSGGDESGCISAFMVNKPGYLEEMNPRLDRIKGLIGEGFVHPWIHVAHCGVPATVAAEAKKTAKSDLLAQQSISFSGAKSRKSAQLWRECGRNGPVFLNSRPLWPARKPEIG